MNQNPKKNTRQTILQHAFELFYQKGYHATGLEELMKAAEVHKGSLYYHFKDKKSLLLAVINELMTTKLQAMYQPLETANKPLETLFQILRVDENFDFQHGCALNNLVQEMSPLDSEIAAALQTIYRQLEDYFIFALQQTQLNEDEIQSLARTLVAGVEGGLMAAKAAQSGAPYYQVLDCLQKMTLRELCTR